MKKSDLKILLVDDEPDIVEILSYNLGKEGYQIFSASNGKEALEKSKLNRATPYNLRRYDACYGWYRNL
jgi:two-component system alkaline phosphatase synthesis response regulator PhoP